MSTSFKPARDRSTSVWNRDVVGSSSASDDPYFENRFGPNYRVRGVIGRGGMGTVLHVESTSDGRSYALKYCHSGENLRRRFVREVRFLSSLTHPNVVPIVDAQLDRTPSFFVMPLAIGSLQDEVEILARKLSTSVQVFREICAGVRAIHDAGVIHRDLKPSNVLRLADGSVVVADLGAAKGDPRHSSVLTGTCAIIGTLAYLAPEQLLPEGSRLADQRADLYQLGKMLYQLVTGLSPAVMDLNRLPVGLAHIVGRATAPSPGDRYPDVDTLLGALDVFEQTSVPATERRERLHTFLDRLDRKRQAHAPTSTDLSESISLLRQFGDHGPGAGLSWFDSLPLPLIRSLARHRPGDFLAIVNLYAKAIATDAPHQDFRYADFVSSRMNEVFRASRHVGLKTRALHIVLITAVALNRYAAMATFKEMLREVKTLALALPVAEMLRDHLDEFREVAIGLDPNRLHPAIRAVLNELTWIETVSF